jgi:hypothetical protein
MEKDTNRGGDEENTEEAGDTGEILEWTNNQRLCQ